MTRRASRISSISESIFATVTRWAVEHQAVNLGQGFPDFDGPEWIIAEAHAAMRAGKNQYAPMHGTRSFRRAVAAYQKRFYGIEWDPEDEITVTAGATEALFCAVLAFVEPGDEVIITEPFYDAHHADVLIAGAVPVCVTLHKPDFRFDPEAFERLVTPRTRMIILNNPDNPTGKVYTDEELRWIADVAVRHDLLVLSDEVYEFLTYDGARHIPLASLPGMRERTIAVSSTGKTFGMTGWKIGYAMAEKGLTDAIRAVHQFATFAVNTPGQHAMAYALGKLEEYLPVLRTLYATKRDLLFAGLCRTPLTPHMPRGGYFLVADIPESVAAGDIACAEHLARHAGVAVIPLSPFYASCDEGKRMLRFCFAKRDETIREGLARLERVPPEAWQSLA
ncbi:MAG: methionine aminotransferase [Bacteroidota bacterium]|nr:methionine aminotransferase [Bacteroidota bacterium]